MRVPLTKRIKPMRFHGKGAVNRGDRVLWRSAPGWGKRWDSSYSITGSDWHRIGNFYHVPKGKKIGDWSVRPGPKKGSTHVELNGVGHLYPTWEEFLKYAVNPKLFYPDMKMTGMPFEIPPDKRY